MTGVQKKIYRVTGLEHKAAIYGVGICGNAQHKTDPRPAKSS